MKRLDQKEIDRIFDGLLIQNQSDIDLEVLFILTRWRNRKLTKPFLFSVVCKLLSCFLDKGPVILETAELIKRWVNHCVKEELNERNGDVSSK